jgi:hypothetical protein
MNRTTMTRIATGIATVTALSTFGVALGTTAAQARPAAFTKCKGQYTAHVKANRPLKGTPTAWKTTVSQLSEQGLNCGTAETVAGQYARATCGACSSPTHVGTYTYKYVPADVLEGYVTATKPGIIVKFFWSTNPA